MLMLATTESTLVARNAACRQGRRVRFYNAASLVNELLSAQHELMNINKLSYQWRNRFPVSRHCVWTTHIVTQGVPGHRSPIERCDICVLVRSANEPGHGLDGTFRSRGAGGDEGNAATSETHTSWAMSELAVEAATVDHALRSKGELFFLALLCYICYTLF